jgi:alkaline phosphatase D
MLGAAQESWLDAGFAASRAKWNLVVQQTMVAQFDQQPGAGRRAWTDSWDGYPAARRKLLESVRDRKVANPVFLGGDVHMFYVTDLKTDFDDAASPVVASEFVGTSITSQSWPQEQVAKFLPDNPHVRHAEARHRGYLRFELSAKSLRAELRGLESEKKADSACSTISAWAVEDGRAGAQKA